MASTSRKPKTKNRKLKTVSKLYQSLHNLFRSDELAVNAVQGPAQIVIGAHITYCTRGNRGRKQGGVVNFVKTMTDWALLF